MCEPGENYKSEENNEAIQTIALLKLIKILSASILRRTFSYMNMLAQRTCDARNIYHEKSCQSKDWKNPEKRQTFHLFLCREQNERNGKRHIY